MAGMSDDKPDPLRDTLKGLGLLFRAARTVAAKIPTKNLEDAVVTSAREVGRAIENVATTLERSVFGNDTTPPGSQGRDASTPTGGPHPGGRPPEPPDGDSPKPKPPG